MKQLLALSALLLFVHTSGRGQEEKHLEGGGRLVVREVPVRPFDALKASGVYELKLTQGATESVKIEADENLQDFFTVKNEGSRLVIHMDKMGKRTWKKGDQKLRVHVTFKNLKSLDLSMVGNVKADKPLVFDEIKISNQSVGNVDLQLKSRKLRLDNSSVGNITLAGEAQQAFIRNEGVGHLKAGNLRVQTVDIRNAGVGGAEINAEKELNVEDSFLGKVKNRGAAVARKRKNAVI